MKISNPTKKEILKMSKEELKKSYLKVHCLRKNIRCSHCSYCSNCSNCFHCSYCSNCFHCSYCTSQREKRFMILDVQFTEEEYKQKLAELKQEINNG